MWIDSFKVYIGSSSHTQLGAGCVVIHWRCKSALEVLVLFLKSDQNASTYF